MCYAQSRSVVSDSLRLMSGSSVRGDSPGKNTAVGCHALLQGIFPTQGMNPGLRHCRWILHCLSHQGSPNATELYFKVVNFMLCEFHLNFFKKLKKNG